MSKDKLKDKNFYFLTVRFLIFSNTLFLSFLIFEEP